MTTKEKKMKIIGNHVFVGEDLFSIPVARQSPYVAGYLQQDKETYKVIIGTGQCCFGNVYYLTSYGWDHGHPKLDSILPADMNVYDLLPAVWAEPYRGPLQSTYGPIVMTGSGCAGAGVRLLDVGHPEIHSLVDRDEYFNLYREFNKKIGGGVNYWPALRLNNAGEIVIDIHIQSYRKVPNQPPSPHPEVEAMIVDNLIVNSITLNDRLHTAGIDIEKTIEQYQQQYRRVRAGFAQEMATMDKERMKFPLIWEGLGSKVLTTPEAERAAKRQKSSPSGEGGGVMVQNAAGTAGAPETTGTIKN